MKRIKKKVLQYKDYFRKFISKGPCIDHRFGYLACLMILSCYMFTVGFVKEICGCNYVQLSVKIFLVNLGAWPLLHTTMGNYDIAKWRKLNQYIYQKYLNH